MKTKTDIISWQGRRLDKMTLREAIAALKHAARLLHDCRYLRKMKEAEAETNSARWEKPNATPAA